MAACCIDNELGRHRRVPTRRRAGDGQHPRSMLARNQRGIRQRRHNAARRYSIFSPAPVLSTSLRRHVGIHHDLIERYWTDR